MNRLFFLFTLLLISAQLFSQQIPPVQPGTQAFYQQKSKRQYTTGYLLVGGGATCTLLLPIVWGVATQNGYGFGIIRAAFVAGLAAIPVGISFLVIANENRKKALRISLNQMNLPVISRHGPVQQVRPSITLNFSL